MKKQISIDHLRPGMYLTGLDQSWWNSPFILHQRLIKSEQEVFKLRQSGVKLVEIDPTKGLDMELPSYPEGIEPEPQRAQATGTVEGSSPEEVPFVKSVNSISRDSPQEEPRPEGVPSNSDGKFLVDGCEEAQAAMVRDAAIQAVEQVFEGVVAGVPLDYPLLQKTAETVVRHITEHVSSISRFVLLQNLRAFNKHLFGHVVDVCALSVVIGIELGWAEEQLHELAIGALLHDIGYMRLPGNLLRQRHIGRQTDSALLRQHAELGVSLLKQNPEISPSILRLVQEHHECLDGSGFPTGMKGDAICPGSHLIGLIDSFDCMTSHWGVTPQNSSAQVLRDLYAAAKSGRFDVGAVEKMIRCLGIYPVGSFVELSTKERGLVTLINPENLLKPVIKVISDADGRLFPSPFFVDLADPDGIPHRTISVLLDPELEGIHVGKYMSLLGTPG